VVEYINKIICGDALDIMQNLDDESVDLVITSPPYNLRRSTGNGMKDGRGGKWKNVARDLGRDYIGIDIAEEYCEIARDRLQSHLL